MITLPTSQKIAHGKRPSDSSVSRADPYPSFVHVLQLPGYAFCMPVTISAVPYVVGIAVHDIIFIFIAMEICTFLAAVALVMCPLFLQRAPN